MDHRRPRIFVSYRRDDTGGHAGRLYDALAAHFGADNVFIDIDTIDLGADFDAVIRRAVTSCDVVVALIGRGWLTTSGPDGRPRLEDPDDFVRLELESALTRGVFVIPACVQGAAIPSPAELPPSLAPLARRQGFELRDAAWHDDVRRLIRRLDRLEGETGAPAEEPALPEPAPQAPRRWSRKALLAVPLLLLAAAVTTAAIVLGGGKATDSGTDSGATTPAERRLLGVIPPVTRHSCERIDYGEESARLSLTCAGVRLAVTYHLFDDRATLNAWYVQRREAAEVTPGSGACTGLLFRGEAAYASGGAASGRRFCFTDGREPELVWTDLRTSVGAEASVYEGEGRRARESLLRQWDCCLRLVP